MTGSTDRQWRQTLDVLGLTTLEGAFAFGGGQDLVKPGLGHRRRTRIETADPAGRPATLYLKRYGPEPLSGRLRRWVQTGRWSSPAAAEAWAIEQVRRAGVDTMELLAWGQESASGRSYIVVSSVAGDALERRAKALLAAGPDRGRQLAESLGELAGRLHAGGLVHRDLYASHVFVDECDGGELRLALIDLARVFRPRRRKRRWRVKDLAQLKYSMPAPWVAAEWDRLLLRYAQRVAGVIPSVYDAAVDRKVARMRRRARRKNAQPDPAGGGE